MQKKETKGEYVKKGKFLHLMHFLLEHSTLRHLRKAAVLCVRERESLVLLHAMLCANRLGLRAMVGKFNLSSKKDDGEGEEASAPSPFTIRFLQLHPAAVEAFRINEYNGSLGINLLWLPSTCVASR